MASLHRVASCVSTVTSSSYVQSKIGDVAINEQFPAGLRVLVVDDCVTTLKVLEKKLHRLLYHVTTCSQATLALKTLRENKGSFDFVLSDVHMPDMDGYKLLEHVGLEMDLPVIMMSADESISSVMKGIRHGACDYLIKPVRDEELKNIWQHVVRKKWNESKEFEHSGSMEDVDQQKRGNDDTDYACAVNEGTEVVLKGQRKRSNTKDEDDAGLEDDDPSTSKKPRVVWSVELHQQFVSAVNQLGIDKAVPKRILELMNVPGLTRENVASHLQKFRLYLKRLSGVAQQGGLHPTFCVPLDSDGKLNILGRYDFQSLVASGHIPPQTLAALQAELFGRSTGSPITTIDQPALLQASLQGPKGISLEPSIAFGHALAKFQSNMSKQFPSSVVSVGEIPSGFGVWPRNAPGSAVPSSNMRAMVPQNANMLLQPQKQQPSSLKESSHSINVQPSCLVVPSHTPSSFPSGNSPPVGQNCSFNSGSINNYSPLSPQSNSSSLPVVQIQGNDLKGTGVISEHSVPRTITSPISSCSATADNTITQQVHNSAMISRAVTQLPELPPSIGNMEGSYDNLFEVIDQGRFGNLGFVGIGTCIPSRFAVDELELPLKNLCQGKLDSINNYNKVKQEPHTDFVDTLTTIGGSIKQQFNPNDLMSVLTD